MPKTEQYSLFEASVPSLDLKELWMDSFKHTEASSIELEKLFQAFEKEYSRPFFNMKLINYLLENFRAIRSYLTSPNTFVWATFFMFNKHVTSKRDTFMQSGVEAGRILKELGISEEQIEKVQLMIFSITNFQTSDKEGDTLYFIDNYLSAFAQHTLTHIQLLELLKKENHFFDDNWFIRSRLHQFNTLLKRKEIFNTIEFYNEYEVQIRKNFLWELNRIR